MTNGNDRSQLQKLVEETIARWRGGDIPDAAEFLRTHPEVGSRKTLALDLIHEEFCLRRETGATIVPSTFIERFPAYQRSIAKMLEVAEFSEQHPELINPRAPCRWPENGEEYQGFEIVEPLGEGAMARVFLARELDMGRRAVVIKVSPYGGHEAHLLGKLGHANIVSAHSVRHDDTTGMTVICMPLLGTATGLDLLDQAFLDHQVPETAAVIGRTAQRYQPAGLVKPESLIAAIPFTRRTYPEGVAWMGLELARGLSAAHAMGVVHRDIKPSNILLAFSGRPMLLDFNLSTDLDDQADRLGGTLAYMAPERIYTLLIGKAAQESTVDPRTDLFSLGAVLYELLAGRLPAQPEQSEGSDDSAMQRWLDVRTHPLIPLSHINRQVDSSLNRIVLRCLSAEPNSRYASADELASALALYLGWKQTATRWGLRNRRRLLVASLGLGGLAVLSGAFWANLPTPFERGLALYSKGQYREAVQAFDQAVSDQPQSAAPLFGRAQSYYRQGEMVFAERDYLAAAAIEDRPLFWFCAGCCGAARGDSNAGAYLGKALQRGYDTAAVKMQMGLWNLNKSESDRAYVFFSEALQANPDLQQAYYFRARIRFSQLKDASSPLLDSVLSDAERAMNLGPPSRLVTRLTAQVYSFALSREPSERERAQDAIRLLVAQGEPLAEIERDSTLRIVLHDIEGWQQLPTDPLQVAPLELPPVQGPPYEADSANIPKPY